jgi:hypothetical protein
MLGNTLERRKVSKAYSTVSPYAMEKQLIQSHLGVKSLNAKKKEEMKKEAKKERRNEKNSEGTNVS